jgi:hypothetical protein
MLVVPFFILTERQVNFENLQLFRRDIQPFFTFLNSFKKALNFTVNLLILKGEIHGKYKDAMASRL